MKNIRNEKGITLVALIITIIVLLILAVVAISAVSGDGILDYSKKSTSDYKAAQQLESIRLALDEWKIQSNLPGNPQTFVDFMRGKLTDATSVTETEEGVVSVTYGTNIYSVAENGNINSVKGLSIDATGFPLVMEEGQAMPTGTLTAILVGVEGQVTWTIQDPSIATLSATEGTTVTVTAVAAGETVVTATCGDATNTYTVVVNEPEAKLLSSVVNVGDYIRYDAGNKAFSMTTEQTGVTGDAQTYNTGTYTWNPETASTSTYGLWRVLSVDDTSGKVEIISYNDVTNGTGLKFHGRVGFLRGVDTLNTFCSNYVNSAYAESGRSIGGSTVGVADESIIPTKHEYSNKDFAIHEDVQNDVTKLNETNVGIAGYDGDKGVWYANRWARLNYMKYESGGVTVGISFIYYFWQEASIVNPNPNNRYIVSTSNDNIKNVNSALLNGYTMDGQGEDVVLNREYTSPALGIIPVITLKPQVSVASGTGTNISPYVLNPVQ